MRAGAKLWRYAITAMLNCMPENWTDTWRAGYIERCMSGSEGSVWKPAAEMRQGAGRLPYCTRHCLPSPCPLSPERELPLSEKPSSKAISACAWRGRSSCWPVLSSQHLRPAVHWQSTRTHPWCLRCGAIWEKSFSICVQRHVVVQTRRGNNPATR